MKKTSPPNGIPWLFYFVRVAALIAAAVLGYMARNEYGALVLVITVAFFVQLNWGFYVIRMYPDRFVICQPSMFGKRFEEEDTYYFADVKDFEFHDPLLSVSPLEALAVIVGESVLPGNVRKNVPVLLQFTHKTIHSEEEISYRFNQNKRHLLLRLRAIRGQLSKQGR